MIIEVYLDTSWLKESQSLVILDDDGRRWDVMEQLNASDSSGRSDSPRPVAKSAEVILERWQVELKTTGNVPSEDFGPILPTIYTKAIVFFRTLFITTRLLPAWKFASQGATRSSHPALIPRCRVRMSEPARSSPDPLRQPIDGRTDAANEYMFGDLDVPVGRLSASVIYRNDCGFRIDDSESLLSSRFMGVDENFFKPSLPPHGERQREPSLDMSSLRGNRRGPGLGEVQQTYGSLSTFHGDGPPGKSPISALRAVRPPGSDTSSPPASLPTNTGPDTPSSLPVSGRPSSSRAPIRVGDGPIRRTSVSFQPFKAGSLSGSPVPRTLDSDSPASTHSLSRPVGLPAGSQPRNRSSLTAGMPASLRGGPPAAPAAPETPVIGSPRPTSTSRFSSSFTHRRGHPSTSGPGRCADEEQSSSGHQSLSSSVAQPGSGLLAEAGPASSSSLHAEEDDISNFLKALDSKKTLRSFETAKRAESATNRTVAQLSRFHMMRDSNNALGDSMTSSMQLQRSSSSSSRQLACVPGMVAPASASTSTSPGKPQSPHTPHTPAVPSRLSENSIIDYGTTGRTATRSGRPQELTMPEPSRESTMTREGTTAIDIPLSPRLGSYQRRSSSVAQQSRAMIEDEDADLAFAAHRSISLGADDREPPTISILLGRQMQMEMRSAARDGRPIGLRSAAEIQPTDSLEVMQRSSAEDNPPDRLMPPVQSGSPFPRRQAGIRTAARPTRQPSLGSFIGSSGRLGRTDDDSVVEEPLVFDLAEMDIYGRRSLEEARSGGNTTSKGNGFEPRGTRRQGWP